MEPQIDVQTARFQSIPGSWNYEAQNSTSHPGLSIVQYHGREYLWECTSAEGKAHLAGVPGAYLLTPIGENGMLKTNSYVQPYWTFSIDSANMADQFKDKFRAFKNGVQYALEDLRSHWKNALLLNFNSTMSYANQKAINEVPMGLRGQVFQLECHGQLLRESYFIIVSSSHFVGCTDHALLWECRVDKCIFQGLLDRVYTVPYGQLITLPDPIKVDGDVLNQQITKKCEEMFNPPPIIRGEWGKKKLNFN